MFAVTAAAAIAIIAVLVSVVTMVRAGRAANAISRECTDMIAANDAMVASMVAMRIRYTR